MSTSTIDFSKYESQAPSPASGAAPQIDFSKYTAPAPKSSLWDQARQSYEAQKNLPPDKRTQSNLGSSSEGPALAENLAGYMDTGPGDIGRGVKDVVQGNIAKGGHEILSGAGTTLAPAMGFVPGGTLLRTAAGGYIGGKAAGAVAQAAGANPDQQQFTEDLGNLAGGSAAGTGAIRAFLGSPAKAALGKVAGAADGIVSDDLLGTISPRALHGLRMLRAANKIIGSTQDSAGLSEIAAKHTEAISGLESQLNDALSKANALPPEGPTAKLTDVPDLRVQPAQQAPMNLMERSKAAFQAARQVTGGQFQVVPPEGSVPSGPSAVIRQVENPAINPGARGAQDVPPSVLRTAGQPQASPQSSTPNGALYNEPIADKTAQQIYAEKFLQKSQPKPTTLDQLKQWDQIRQIHSQLEGQIGKGQDDIQQWMEDHNTQAPGGSAAQAKAAPQGGHAGNGVSSVEELNRPGNNYVVSRSGQLTYQGKSFAPESTPNGATHVTVKPDGTFQVNAGPKLNPAQEFALNKALNKPRTPVTDADLEETIMKSIQNANAKARSAKAGDD